MRRRYYICALLFLLVSINYLDRSVLSVAAKDVATEFGFSPVAMGYLFSSFVWTYALFIFITGYFIDRYSTKRIQLVGGTIWGAATFLTGFVWSFPSFVGLRMLMGAAEATSLPTCNKIVREWMPAAERGVATTMYSAGTFGGSAMSALIVGAVTASYGWRAAFMVAGALALIWLIPFGIWFDRPERVRWLKPEERDKIVAERVGDTAEFDRQTPAVSLRQLLGSRTLWGLAITQGCAVYANNVFLFWLPSYLQSTRGLTVLKTGLYTAVPYALTVLLTISIGLLSDRIIRRGGGGVAGGRRRNVVAVAMLCASVILATPMVESIWVMLALTTISLTGIGTTLALNGALLSDLQPSPRNLGKTTGTVWFIGQIAGIAAPIVSGYIIAWSGFRSLFVVCGFMLIVGSVSSLTLTHRPLPAGRPVPA